FRPGVAERLGIDAASLLARNPRLVHCAITGYGPDGPDRDLKSYDLMAQAAAGLMGLSGEPDGPPMKIGSAFSDMVAGTYAALAILGAVHERNRSGHGQSIDVSMVDCLFAMMMDEPLDWYERLGLAPRQGNRIMRFSPFNAYRARDGWVTLGAVNDAEWHALLVVIGREDLKTHPDFSRPQWRIAHNEQVDALIQDWVCEHPVSEIAQRLRAADVPCSPVRTPQEALAWPHLHERGMLRPLARPDGVATAALASELPMKFSRSLAAHDRPAPPPGADTDEILTRYLRLTPQELAALREDGII
ncbi:MAG: CoA transferase, partial [Gammaproteobacteria bacterium]|nr:CoA transferase [Gammaproteobacteria bacterium]